MYQASFIQEVNWRTVVGQFIDAAKSRYTKTTVPIDLTGATGVLVVTFTANLVTNSYSTPITLGKPNSMTQAEDAINGWCYATFEGINMPGTWSEQLQLVLPTGEPLNGGAFSYTVSANLTPP
jgi:hypothetical protein